MRIVYWGTYDKNRERYRILTDAFKQAGIHVIECHEDVWAGIRDKSTVSGWRSKFRIFGRHVFAYLKLLINYLFLPEHDAVFVGYMGHIDVIALWPAAKLRRKQIIWDALISIYITTTSDRRMVDKCHPLARLIYLLEWFSCHLADRIFLPSNARASLFTSRYHLPESRAKRVFLGAETKLFPRRKPKNKTYAKEDPISVVFYGQFIPMHGVETIIYAARLLSKAPIHWTIIGSGQVAPVIRKLLDERPLPNLTWNPWVPYTKLYEFIHQADIALGIFGESEKAETSIPNKVFQILSTGTPLITRDSKAIRELLDPTLPGIYLVPPTNPQAIVDALQKFGCDRQRLASMELYTEKVELISPSAIGKRIFVLMTETIEQHTS